MSADTPTDDGLDRRTYLSALATATAAGLAGCGGGNGSSGGNGSGSSQQELGERVPTVPGVALGGVAGASGIEQTMNHVKQQVNKVLGVPMEISIMELTSFWNAAYNDSRDFNLHVDLSPPFPSNLDPSGLLTPYHIRNAGANGRANIINYADCKYTRKLEAQQSAPNRQKRQQLVTQTTAAASEDIAPITLNASTNLSAYRTDQLKAAKMGQVGPNTRNPPFLWNTNPTGSANGILSNNTPGNMPSVAYMASRPATPWAGTVYLPLVIRDQNNELAAGLATDWNDSNGYKTFTFDLHPDATFHNGNPVTAEDVKWTLEFLNNNTGAFPPVNEYPYASINAVDEKTVEVNMETAQPSWLPGFVPVWSGVLPKDVWTAAGAEENPANPNLDTIVGSGPYQVTDFQPRQLLSMEPYDDHFINVNGNLTYRGYQDRQSARRAFEQGNLNLLLNITNDTASQLRDNLGQQVKVESTESFTSFELRSQHSFAPTMFREFRLAVSQSLNRQLINEIISAGEGQPELYSSFLGKNHPWRPESNDPLTKIADSPQANPEKAKQVLRDAGWGWDGDGRLHYPADKDLTPRWPKGSTPCDNPEGFPCLPELCK